jgi:hypothetical protein
LSDIAKNKKENFIVCLKSFNEEVGSEVKDSSAYAIYLGASESIADWIDLQVLITQKNLAALDLDTINRLKQRGTALFKSHEQAQNVLLALERSIKS